MSRVSSVQLAGIRLTAGVSFLIYILLAGLDTTGRHLFVISLARLGFAAGLIAAVATFRPAGTMARAGLWLAMVAAVLNLVGAVGHVVTDGWAYNPFDDDTTDDTPWYAFVIGATGVLFGIGTVLVGITALRSRVPRDVAVAILLGGILVVVALGLAAIGHALWTLPWLAVAFLTLRAQQESARSVASS